MADRARHAFGALADVEAALAEGKIDNYDILFLDGDTDKPKVGWIDRNGKLKLADGSTDLTEIEAAIAEKVDAETVQTMIKEYSESTVDVVEF